MNLHPTKSTQLKCPTCNASQEEAPECRRCKCDLTLVLGIRNQIRELHQKCLSSLATGQREHALALARELHALSPDETTRRLLAVCWASNGQFHSAREICNSN